MKKTAAIFALLFATAVPGVAAERVRVSVFGLFHPKQVSVQAIAGQPLKIVAGAEQMTLSSSGRNRILLNSGGGNVVVHDRGRELSAAEVQGSGQRGGDDADFVLTVPGKIHREFHGRLLVSSDRGELVAVVEMDMEVAVASIVAAEMRPDAPLEAMKAQAVVSRSYLVAAGKRHVHADFCDTTHCQFIRRPPEKASAAERAAAETAGIVLAWQEKPFAAMYSASCGGKTRTLTDAGFVTRDYPYFAVECAYCRRSPERWSSTVRASDVDGGKGEGARIRAGRKLGWSAVPSNSYDLKRNADGSMELTGVGRGHGIGLCQMGAAGMAREGKDFREILAHYFPNTTLKSMNK